jgi:hypothetical protein
LVWATPALATMTSREPSWLAVSATRRWTSSGLVTSPVTAMALTPLASISLRLTSSSDCIDGSRRRGRVTRACLSTARQEPRIAATPSHPSRRGRARVLSRLGGTLLMAAAATTSHGRAGIRVLLHGFRKLGSVASRVCGRRCWGRCFAVRAGARWSPAEIVEQRSALSTRGVPRARLGRRSGRVDLRNFQCVRFSVHRCGAWLGQSLSLSAAHAPYRLRFMRVGG